jgi:tRNA C32,U32 (ribose-2'-O)-methylase TrmJ
MRSARQKTSATHCNAVDNAAFEAGNLYDTMLHDLRAVLATSSAARPAQRATLHPLTARASHEPSGQLTG